MSDGQEQHLNVAPWLAAAALVLAVVALGIAVVALSKDDGGTGMSSMAEHGGGHMSPISIDGITDPPSAQGGMSLKGTERSGELEFKLDARPVWWNVYGKQRVAAWAYNGVVPGPQIRVRNGQRVRIKFTNRLPEATTIHWHGISVPNSQDGVPDITQKPIQSGESFVYEFTAKPAGKPDGSGTFLYHSHLDEDRQMSAGLSGVFIIDPATGTPDLPEQTLLASEWTVDTETGRTRGAMQMDGMFPNIFTFNGRSYPDTKQIDVKAGREMLLRLVNAGQFAHPLHLHGTAFKVVARDGHPTDDQSLRDTITLESGERADIAFKLPKGKWIFHCHIGHHMTNDGDGPGGLLTVIQAT